MIGKGLDFSKIPFFRFIFVYFISISAYAIFIYGIKTVLKLQDEFVYGAYACTVVQVCATVLRIFFLNYDWKSPITIQYFIFGISFLINIVVVYLLTLLSHNVIAIVGFFVTYFIHLKLILFLGYKLTIHEEESNP